MNLNKNYHWIMLFLIWSVYTCFGLVSGSLSPISPLLINKLNLTYTEMGIILGFWQFVYIFTAIPTGSIIDKWKLKKSVLIGIIVMLISMITRGLAIDFYTLLLSVAIFGFGGPIASSGSPKLVATWFQDSKRGFASGIYTTGPVIGNAIAFATAANISLYFDNWRMISVIYGIILISVMTFWILFSKNKSTNNPAKQKNGKSSYRELFKIKTIQTIMILSIIFFFLNHSLGAWTPSILIDKNFSITQAGYIASICTLISLISLILVTSFFPKNKRKQALIYILLVCSIGCLGIAYASNYILVGSILLVTIFKISLMPLSTLILMDHKDIGPQKIGTAAGMFFASAEIGGFGGPFTIGLLREITGSHQFGGIFSSILCLIGIIIALRLDNNDIPRTIKKF